jgi:hypothetical protein
MTNMNDLVSVTNHAAGQSDRWLFIATLLVLGVFAVGVMRYFVRQHERLIADHREARDAYQSSLSEMVSEQSAANQKLIVCLENNTRVLEECRDELRFSRIERTALNHGTHQTHERGTE